MVSIASDVEGIVPSNATVFPSSVYWPDTVVMLELIDTVTLSVLSLATTF